MHKKNPDTIPAIRDHFVSTIKGTAIENLESFYEEIGLKDKLDILDQLDYEQGKSASTEKSW